MRINPMKNGDNPDTSLVLTTLMVWGMKLANKNPQPI
jgi:hypothetical protein